MKTRVALAVVNLVFAGVCLNGVSNLDEAPSSIIKAGWSTASFDQSARFTEQAVQPEAGVTDAAKAVYSFWYAGN